MKKILFFLVLAFQIVQSQAQILKAELVASGLTCSMCSFATQKQLKTIPYIDSIGTDLEHTTFILYFKKGMEMDFTLLKTKVQDAGFSVASLVFTYRFENKTADANFHLSSLGNLFHFIGLKPQVLTGDLKFRVVDKGFLSDKQFKKYQKTALDHNHSGAGVTTEALRVVHVVLL